MWGKSHLMNFLLFVHAAKNYFSMLYVSIDRFHVIVLKAMLQDTKLSNVRSTQRWIKTLLFSLPNSNMQEPKLRWYFMKQTWTKGMDMYWAKRNYHPTIESPPLIAWRRTTKDKLDQQKSLFFCVYVGEREREGARETWKQLCFSLHPKEKWQPAQYDIYGLLKMSKMQGKSGTNKIQPAQLKLQIHQEVHQARQHTCSSTRNTSWAFATKASNMSDCPLSLSHSCQTHNATC